MEEKECKRGQARGLFIHLNGLKGADRNNADSFELVQHFQHQIVKKSSARVYMLENGKDKFCTAMNDILD